MVLIILLILWILNGIFCAVVLDWDNKLEKNYSHLMLFKDCTLDNYTAYKLTYKWIIHTLLLGIGTCDYISKIKMLYKFNKNIKAYQKEYDDIKNAKAINELYKYISSNIYRIHDDKDLSLYVSSIMGKYEKILKHIIPMYKDTSRKRIETGFTIIKNIMEQDILIPITEQKIANILYSLNDFLSAREKELDDMKKESDETIKFELCEQADEFILDTDTLSDSLNGN